MLADFGVKLVPRYELLSPPTHDQVRLSGI